MPTITLKRYCVEHYIQLERGAGAPWGSPCLLQDEDEETYFRRLMAQHTEIAGYTSYLMLTDVILEVDGHECDALDIGPFKQKIFVFCDPGNSGQKP